MNKTVIILLIILFPIALRGGNRDEELIRFRHSFYPEVNSMSWSQLTEEQPFRYAPPMTVNLLINPVHSPDWLFVNPSLVLSRRTVTQGVANNPERDRQAKTQDDMLLMFAFDDPPFVPNFRLSKMWLKDNHQPVAFADYYANNIYYRLEYIATKMEDGQTAVCVNVTVHNESTVEKEAHVRTKLAYYPEDKIFDYHYIPFSWDASKWRPYEKVSLHENSLMKNGKPIGCIVPGTMKMEWEEKKVFADSCYEKLLYPQVWYGSGYALKEFRLKEPDHVVHLTQKLKPNEMTSFYVKLLVNDAQATSQQYAQLAAMTPDEMEQQACRDFDNSFSEGSTQLIFNKNHWSDIFHSLQLSVKQMLIQYPGSNCYQTAQGGSSERFYVWVFEAVNMMRSMLRTGQTEDVRRALDFIFSLQDAGVPPMGRFTTTKGAVGTTGPRWANTTGMALVLASDYYLYTHDKDFLEAYLPKIMKAVKWIDGELRATRHLNPDGTMSWTYGIMPYAVGCDGDTGFCISDTDLMTFWGFSRTVQLLEGIGHRQARSLRSDLEDYRRSLMRVIRHLTHPDGYIDRILTVEGVKQQRAPAFDICDNMVPMAYVGLVNAIDSLFRNYMNFFEHHYSDDFFMGAIDREIMYTNQCEHDWQRAYLRLGQWKKAFVSTQTCLKYGMSQDCFQTSERMSKRDDSFAPWQPNGSACGRVTDLMLNAFYFESTADSVTLLGALPPQWLTEAGGAKLKNLHTQNGTVDEEITIGSNGIVLTLTASEGLPAHVCIPSHFRARVISGQAIDEGNEWFSVKGKTVSFRLEAEPSS